MPTFLRDEADEKDTIYIAFIAIVIAFIIGFREFFYSSITTKPIPRGISFYSVTLMTMFIFFGIIELIGIIYEIKLFKYFSEHGLTFSVGMLFLVTVSFLPLRIFEKYVNLEDVHYIIEFFGILLDRLLLLLPLYLILRYYLKINKLFADRLLGSNKYAPLKDQYGENIYRITITFYKIFYGLLFL